MSDGRSGPPRRDRALVESAAHVFVGDLELPVPSTQDAHHLERVLRLRDGEPVTISDGRGRWRTGVFRMAGRAGPSSPWLETTGPIVEVARPAPLVAIAFAVPKGDRPDLVVQKLTEIGADELIPMATARGVVRWDAERAEKHRQRFVRIAHEAAAQSRRTWLPVISPLSPFGAVAARPGAALAAPGGTPPGIETPLILVGPEGGWSDDELAAARSVVGLGPHVLRVETAAIVACTLLVADRARSVNT